MIVFYFPWENLKEAKVVMTFTDVHSPTTYVGTKSETKYTDIWS